VLLVNSYQASLSQLVHNALGKRKPEKEPPDIEDEWLFPPQPPEFRLRTLWLLPVRFS